MLKAIIFDFDGVIADAEPIHLRAFQSVLSEEGINLSQKDYYDKYLAFDDKTCFEAVLRDNGIDFDRASIDILMLRKSGYYNKSIRENLIIFPGVVDFVRKAYGEYPLAIGSGALRHEIEFILECAGIRKEFKIIVSADDIENCKPNPEVFQKVLERINKLSSMKSEILYPNECLVIEDSIAGINAAHTAGMKCLAVTNSYPYEKLSKADMIVRSLEELKIEELNKLF
ncbi:MAG: HAD family phosphatase [Candidatus Dadabacteria bacterium]|nr:HAD family phosphatase [Candidatus Dadabacteria bacterium]